MSHGYENRHGRTVGLFVHDVKGKRLNLSTPNLVHVYSIAVARHALTLKSKGQRS